MKATCTNMVLGTDMKKHFDIVSRFQVRTPRDQLHARVIAGCHCSLLLQFVIAVRQCGLSPHMKSVCVQADSAAFLSSTATWYKLML